MSDKLSLVFSQEENKIDANLGFNSLIPLKNRDEFQGKVIPTDLWTVALPEYHSELESIINYGLQFDDPKILEQELQRNPVIDSIVVSRKNITITLYSKRFPLSTIFLIENADNKDKLKNLKVGNQIRVYYEKMSKGFIYTQLNKEKLKDFIGKKVEATIKEINSDSFTLDFRGFTGILYFMNVLDTKRLWTPNGFSIGDTIKVYIFSVSTANAISFSQTRYLKTKIKKKRVSKDKIPEETIRGKVVFFSLPKIGVMYDDKLLSIPRNNMRYEDWLKLCDLYTLGEEYEFTVVKEDSISFVTLAPSTEILQSLCPQTLVTNVEDEEINEGEECVFSIQQVDGASLVLENGRLEGRMNRCDEPALIEKYAVTLLCYAYPLRLLASIKNNTLFLDARLIIQRQLEKYTDVKTLTMRTLFANPKGTSLLVADMVFAEIEKNEIFQYDIIKVAIDYINYDKLCLNVVEYKEDPLWKGGRFLLGTIVDSVTISSVYERGRYRVQCQDIEAKLWTANDTLQIGDVVTDLVIANYDTALKKLDLLERIDFMQPSSIIDEKQMAKVVRIFSSSSALAKIGDKYILIKKLTHNVFFREIVYLQLMDVMVEVEKHPEMSTAVFVAKPTAIPDLEKTAQFARGAIFDVKIESKESTGFIVSFGDYRGRIANEWIDELDYSKQIGETIKAKAMVFSEVPGFIYEFSSKILLENNWSTFPYAVGDVVNTTITSKDDKRLIVNFEAINIPVPRTVFPDYMWNYCRDHIRIQLYIEELEVEKHFVQFSLAPDFNQVPPEQSTDQHTIVEFDDVEYIGEHYLYFRWNSLLATIPLKELGWNNFTIESKFLAADFLTKKASLLFVDSQTHEISFSVKQVTSDPWLTHSLSSGMIVEANYVGVFDNELYFDYEGIKFILNHQESAILMDLPDLAEIPGDMFNPGDLVKFEIIAIDSVNRLVEMKPVKDYRWQVGSKLQATIVEIEPEFITLQNYAGLRMSLSKENLSCFSIYDLKDITDLTVGMTIDVEIIAPEQVRYVTQNEEVFYHGSMFKADIVSVTDRILTLCYQGHYGQIMESGAVHIPESIFTEYSLKDLFEGQSQLPVEVVCTPNGTQLVLAQYSRPEISDSWMVLKRNEQSALMKCRNSFGIYNCSTDEELPASLILRTIKVDEAGFFYLKKDYNQLVDTMHGQVLKCTIMSIQKHIVMTCKQYPFVSVTMPLNEYSWGKDKPQVGTTVKCQVINVNSTLLSVTVSRKAILLYPYSRTSKGETVSLRLKGTLKGRFVFQGNGIEASLPYKSCLCYNVDDCHDLIDNGDIVRCYVENIDHKNNLTLSLNSLYKYPWTSWLKNWRVGEIHPFRIEQLGNKFLYIRTRELIIALDRQEIFLHPIHHNVKDEFRHDQIVNVEILELDCENQHIGVRIIDYFAGKSHSFENGQVIAGKVISATKKGILLNSDDASIFIPEGEISIGILKHNEIPYKIGNFVQAVITDYIEQDGYYLGSVKKLVKDNVHVSPLAENQLCEVSVKSLGTDHADVEYHGYHGVLPYTEAGISESTFAKRFPMGAKLYAILSKIEYDINRLQFSMVKMTEFIKLNQTCTCEVVRVNKKSITVSFMGIEKEIEMSNLKILPENDVDMLLFYDVHQSIEVKVTELISTKSILTLKVNGHCEHWLPVNEAVGSIISNAKIIAISEICAYLEKDNQLIRVSRHDFFWNQTKQIKDYYQVGNEIDVEIIEHKQYYSVGSVNALRVGTEQDRFKEINVGDVIEVIVKAINEDCLVCSYRDFEVVVYKNNVYWYGEPVMGNNLLNDYAKEQEITVKVTTINRQKQKLLASIKHLSSDPFLTNHEGDKVEGEIIKVTPKYYIVKWNEGLGLLESRFASRQKTDRLNPELRYQVGDKLDVSIYRLNEETHVINLNSIAFYENVFEEDILKNGELLKGCICSLTERGALLDFGRSLRTFVPAYKIYRSVGDFKRLLIYKEKGMKYIDSVLTGVDRENRRITVTPKCYAKYTYQRKVGDKVNVYIIDALRNSLTVRTEDGFYGYIDCSEVDYKAQIPFTFRSLGDNSVAHTAVYLGQDDYGVPLFSMKQLLPVPYTKYLTRNYRCHGKVLGFYNPVNDNQDNNKPRIYVELEDVIGMMSLSNKKHMDRIHQTYFSEGEEHEFISVGVAGNMVLLSYLPDQFVEKKEIEATLIGIGDDYIFFEIQGEHPAYASVSKKDPMFMKACTNKLGVLSVCKKGLRCLLKNIEFDPVRRLGNAEFVRILEDE